MAERLKGQKSPEIVLPKTEVFIMKIEQLIDSSEKLVLTKTDKISAAGRRLAQDLYDDLKKSCHGDYAAMLEDCKLAEYELDTEDQNDKAIRVMIRSIRGKIIYQASKTYVERQYLTEFSKTDAVSVTRHRKNKEAVDGLPNDIYALATQIERDKPKPKTMVEIGVEFDRFCAEAEANLIETINNLKTDSKKIVQADTDKNVWDKLIEFATWLVPAERRQPLVAVGLATLAIVTAFNVPGWFQTQPAEAAPNKPVAPAPVNNKVAVEFQKFKKETQSPTHPIAFETTRHISPQKMFVETNESEQKIYAGPTKLDLTGGWDANVYQIKPSQDGEIEISASLFIGKATKFNYGPRTAPDGSTKTTTLMWNSIEAIHNFGSKILKPGDKIIFSEEINLGDKIIGGETEHGDGYFTNINGICNAATVLGEAFGIEIQLPNGVFVPLFIARPGGIQAHDLDHNPEYYRYAYHGAGIAINSTPEGKLEFMLNPNLPKDIIVDLGLYSLDSNPENTYVGLYRPTVNVKISGLPADALVRYQRTTANRSDILERMTGSQDFWKTGSTSVWWDDNGNPIITEPKQNENIDGIGQAEPIVVIEDNTKKNYATTNAPQEWLPLNPKEYAPVALQDRSPEKILEIIEELNIDDPKNLRYQANADTTFCNIVVSDFTKILGVEIPRFVDGQKTNANWIVNWLADPERGGKLGWQNIDSNQAQDLANKGLPVVAVMEVPDGIGHVAIVIPGEGEYVDAIFYPNSAHAAVNNFVGESTYKGFRHKKGLETGIKYYVNYGTYDLVEGFDVAK